MTAPIEWRGATAYIGDRRLGYVNTTRSGTHFNTYRIRDVHFHRNMNGWGISTQLLEDLQKRGIEVIVLNVKGESKLAAFTSTWLHEGKGYQAEGYEHQTMLGEKHFTKVVGNG
jgi:hypothetical protein